MRRRLSAAILTLLIALLCFEGAFAEDVPAWSREHPEILVKEHLYSEAAALLDGDTGELLFNKNAHVRMYPASTTKVMTLLLALESGIPLDREITIPKAAGNIPEGSSVVPVYPGEKMTFRDLLYGFMMKSGNDGANAIAVLVSDSIEGFVELMNERAAGLGCTDTHFVNAHGYHDKNHYSTAADLGTIAVEAMKNPDFREIVATARYTMAATSRRGPLEIVSRNELVNPDSKYYYPDAVGIKTGYHSRAGQCLVGGAVREGKLLVSVTLNSDGQNESLKWYDTARLFEYGYTCYEQMPFAELAATLPGDWITVSVGDAAENDPEGGRLQLQLADMDAGNAFVSVRRSDGAAAEEMRRLWESADVSLPVDVEAPVRAGDALGSFSCTLPAGQTVTASLVAARDVAAQPEPTPTPEPATQRPEMTEAPAAPEAPHGFLRLELVLLALGGIAAAAVIVLAVQEARSRAARKKRAQARRKKRANGGRRPQPKKK